MRDNIGKWMGPLLLSLLIHAVIICNFEIPRAQVKTPSVSKTISVKLARLEQAETTKDASSDKNSKDEVKNHPAFEVMPKKIPATKTLIEKKEPTEPKKESATIKSSSETKKEIASKNPSSIDAQATHLSKNVKEIQEETRTRNSGEAAQKPAPSQAKSVQYEKGDGQAGAVNLSNDVSNNSPGWQQKSLQMASDLDILRSVKPTYPLISRRRGEEGTTTIYVRVSSDGTVVEANVYKSSGYDLLDESALKAVKQWVFKSTKEGEFLVPVVFKLKP